jgi:hypothetical protein
MRSCAPLFLLAAAATAASHDYGQSEQSAGTCDIVPTNSNIELEAAVSSLLANSKATGGFADALSALLANATVDTEPAEKGSLKARAWPRLHTSTTSADDSTAADDAGSSSAGESGQEVPAAGSGRAAAMRKALARLRGSGGASDDVSGDASVGASRGASGGASSDASGDVSGDASPPPPPSADQVSDGADAAAGGAGAIAKAIGNIAHRTRPPPNASGSTEDAPSADEVSDGANAAAGGVNAVAQAVGTIAHSSKPPPVPDTSEGGGMSGASPLLRPRPRLGRLRGLRSSGGMKKRQAANSMEDVVGLDLNKLSAEELKELDGENDAAPAVDEADGASSTQTKTFGKREADISNPTKGPGRPITAREAAPQVTNIIPREEVDPTKGPGPITAREAAPQTTNLGEFFYPDNDKREAAPQTSIIPPGNDKREAAPFDKDNLRNGDDHLVWQLSADISRAGKREADASPQTAVFTGYVGKREADPLPQTAVFTGYVGKRAADAADDWNGPAPTPGGVQVAPPPAAESFSGVVARDYAEPTKRAKPTNKPVGPREAAPSGFYTSTLLRARANDDEEIHVVLDPAAPPTYGGPTPR